MIVCGLFFLLVNFNLVPASVLVLLGVVIFVWLPFQRSVIGRTAYAVGSSELSAYMSGMPLNHVIWNMLPVAGDPLSEEELSRLTALGRERLVAYLDFWRARVPGMAGAVIEQTGFALGVRESRRIHGRQTLDAEMVLGAVKQPDALGHGVWMIDIHDPLCSGYTTYTDRGGRNMLAAGTSYHLPLGMCLTDRVPNLGVVGRCASSTHEALASCRVQTHCMVLGQGVGTAAALALDAGVDLHELSLPLLHSALRADGVYLEDVPTT